jgi:16S rRNA (cytidine1402-2'-O)-methyltransferase
VSNQPGTLFVVATPIGNLEDISPRALSILNGVDHIAAEDTRHSKKLLSHYSIKTPVLSFHEFNEHKTEKRLIKLLLSGSDIALISDAGTPLINDPGFSLVKLCHINQIKVVPIPGPSALICALSGAGLATDRFVFEGFPPQKQSARIRMLKSLSSETRTLIFYETPHRILGFLRDINTVFGGDRLLSVARELTKKYEEIRLGKSGEILEWLENNQEHQKGEFVVILEGNTVATGEHSIDPDMLMRILLEELPVKNAARIASRITGLGKNEMYQLGLKIHGD